MNQIEAVRRRFAPVLLGLLWIDAALIAIATHLLDARNALGLALAGVALALVGSVSWLVCGTGWQTRQWTSLAAMAQIMLLVYAFSGHGYQADIHMAFFAMMAVLSGWLDWRIFVTCTIAIALHHAGLNLLQSDGVFPGGSDTRRVLLHAIIVVLQAVTLGWVVDALTRALTTSSAERDGANAARLKAERAEQQLTRSTLEAALERQRLISAMADELEREIAGVAQEVIASVTPLRQAARDMSNGAKRVARGSETAAASSVQASVNAEMVTRATRELAGSIGEIKSQVTEAVRIVDFTTQNARSVLATVNQLSAKADDVGQIVQMISAIADRTNLLALNASIEAARFGASGSGFAVVAQEVKQLANQTSRATSDIQQQIAAIRSSGDEAIRAIALMDETVAALNTISAAVAAVVTQQDQATAGIALSIQDAAEDAAAVSQTIRLVTGVAAATDATAHSVAEAADKLALQAGNLDTQVRDFLDRIRSAA